MRRGPAVLLLLVAACGGGDGASGEPDVPVPGRPGARKTAAAARAARRAFDGAPPVIPHDRLGACLACHGEERIEVPGLGLAPKNPHGETPGMGDARCEQCHVFQRTDEVFVASEFEGRPQDLRAGPRAYEGAPAALPHPVFLREDCLACHAGPAAREELRCTHPERTRCLQCHARPGDAPGFMRE